MVFWGLVASNFDQPQPSPQSLFPGNRPTLSFTMTHQPARVPALLPFPINICWVVVLNTSFTRTVPSGKCPSLRYAAMVPGEAYTTCSCFEPGPSSLATAQLPSI